MVKKLFEIKNVEKDFTEGKNTVKAVRDISLDIYEGETLGLVGESGCGKSTFGSLLLHLNEVTSGKIIFEGRDITKVKKEEYKELCKSIQIVFQDPYSSIDSKKTIGWLVEEPLVIHKIGKSKEERRKKAVEMLKEVGLDLSYYDRYPSELSGGQRQRVAIAIALILQPKFVVCDEAVSALDVSVQAQILNLLKDLQKKHNLTYLFISHNLNVVSYMADRIGVMYLGSIVELGSVLDVSTAPKHPYSKALFSASVSANDNSTKQRIILKGDIPSPSNPPEGCPFHTRCVEALECCDKERPFLCELENGHLCACHRVNKGE